MPEFTATVRSKLGINEITGAEIFDVLITHPINIGDREEQASYPRIIEASGPEELEAAIHEEVNIIKANLYESDHPAVGQEFKF